MIEIDWRTPSPPKIPFVPGNQTRSILGAIYHTYPAFTAATLPAPSPGAVRKYLYLVIDTKQEAEKWVRDLEAQVDRFGAAPDTKILENDARAAS